METARSGDFGYARGAYAAASAPGVPLGWYLRVWRREGADWRIVMDVVKSSAFKDFMRTAAREVARGMFKSGRR